MASKSFTTTLVRDAGMSGIPIPFDPKTVFGKARAPVRVTLKCCRRDPLEARARPVATAHAYGGG